MDSVYSPLPRVTIQFCTQCKWMLRAAYFAQELLSTFGTTLGEVALQPSTGGAFIISLYSSGPPKEDGINVYHNVIWDRKADGGFPETKELKRRVRDIIDPGRNLGHVDVKKSVPATEADISEHERKEANGEHDAFKDNNPISKTLDEQDIRRPRAISDVQNPGQEQERKFTPQDVDERDMNKDGLKAGVKRNPDGSICQDCN